MNSPKTMCGLCSKSEEQVRFKVLVTVSNAKLSSWTHNILSLQSPNKLCITCCQNIVFVTEMLYQWQNEITISMDSVQNNERASQASSLVMKEISNSVLATSKLVPQEDLSVDGKTTTIGNRKTKPYYCLT